MIRKIKKYIEFFGIPLILIIFAVILITGPKINTNIIPDSKKIDFNLQLIATLLGVIIAIFIEKAFQKRTEYLRIKKTFGLLKLITIPYLKNQATNMIATLKNYNDIYSIEQAESFVRLGVNFIDKVMVLDKKWIELIYSQEFLDTIESDNQFNNIAYAIFEILIYTSTLSDGSINLQQFNNVPTEFKDNNYKNVVISRTRQIRDELKLSAEKMLKYTEKLEEEIDRLFDNTGVKYEEFER